MNNNTKCTWRQKDDGFWWANCETGSDHLSSGDYHNEIREMQSAYKTCPSCKNEINFIPLELEYCATEND